MKSAHAIAFLLGSLGVLQAALNRRISATTGLPLAILINGGVVLACAAAFFLATRAGLLRFESPATPGAFQAHWLIPGLFGFALITGFPYAIARVGALVVFVAAVSAQMATSIVWDSMVEGIRVTPGRLGGAALCVVGVAITLLADKSE